MTNTLAEAIAWGPAHPYRDNGTPWAPRTGPTWCEAALHQMGGFTQTYPSAYAAALASGPLNPDPNPANMNYGECLYFAGESGLGHDGMWLPSGFYCASEKFYATGGLGSYQNVTEYLVTHPGFRFLGHTYRHGTETIQIPPPHIGDGMTSFFYKFSTYPGTPTNPTLWAMAGDSPGTPANWLETYGQPFFALLQQQHNAIPAAGLSDGTWDQWKAAYLAPMQIAAPPVSATPSAPLSGKFTVTPA